MKNIYSAFTIAIILTSLLYVKNSQAQNSGLRYFLLKPSARSMALGGSGVSYYGNDFSVFDNPALITDSHGIFLLAQCKDENTVLNGYKGDTELKEGDPVPFFAQAELSLSVKSCYYNSI
jgi:hypothetical protein